MKRLIALTATAALLAAIAPAAPAAASAQSAHAAKKKCKKGHKKKCRRHHGPTGPSPYAEGQPCDPANAKAYAKYGFLCLPQPQPDGTTKNELIPALA